MTVEFICGDTSGPDSETVLAKPCYFCATVVWLAAEGSNTAAAYPEARVVCRACLTEHAQNSDEETFITCEMNRDAMQLAGLPPEVIEDFVAKCVKQ